MIKNNSDIKLIEKEMDIYIGGKLRELRKFKDVSQKDLANIVGLTFQQIQKYERGTNRISVSRLYTISNALDVNVIYFYKGITSVLSSKVPNNLLSQQEQKLLQNYRKIENQKLCSAVSALLYVVAK